MTVNHNNLLGNIGTKQIRQLKKNKHKAINYKYIVPVG